MSSVGNIVVRLKNERDKLCASAKALGAECLCDVDATSVVDIVVNIGRINDAIGEMVTGTPLRSPSSEERRRRRSRSPPKRERSYSPLPPPPEKRGRDNGKHDSDPKSIYIRYITGHDAFVGRASRLGEEKRLFNIFSDFGKVERTYSWYYEGDEDGIPGKHKIPMARVRFYDERDKEYALNKAEEIAKGRNLFIGATKFDKSKITF